LNLSQVTGCLDWSFLLLFSVSPFKYQASNLKWTMTAYFQRITYLFMITFKSDMMQYKPYSWIINNYVTNLSVSQRGGQVFSIISECKLQ
jgi:hypothetical protein